jgi:hypothetical protein
MEVERREREAVDAAANVEREKVAAREKAAKAKAEADRAARDERDRKRRSGTDFSKLSMKDLEKRIERNEARIREIDESMMDPAIYTDGRRTKELDAERRRLSDELEPLEFEWSCRAEDA